MKHTPGQWEVIAVKGGWDGVGVDYGGHRLEICKLVHNNPHNAYLMAASPDLYDGCNALLGLIQLILDRDDISDGLDEVLRNNHRIAEAQQAIAKATGGTK